MDFTPELSAFQGVIISSDNVHSFSKLSARGGNEAKIDFVTNSILKFLEQEKYVDKNSILEDKLPKMRKFALFLVLNADLPVLQEMVEMDGIDLVIWTIPTIPKYLMCEMFWNLHMDNFVYEIIAFCYPQLALEVAGAFINNIKYFSPSKCLDKLKKICAACYRLTCRLHFFNFEDNFMSNMLTSAFNNFLQCFNYFVTPPNAGKLISLSKDDQYKYNGHCLHTILLLLKECLEQFTTIQEFSPYGFHEIYQLTYKVGSYKEDALGFNVCDSPNNTILDCLDKSNMVLMDKSMQLVMDVSVDIFCAWSEFEENGKSMQQTIGELCYQLSTQLSKINSLKEHPFLNMIREISHKPEEIGEIINATDSTTIIENINKNDDKKSWVCALIHKENVCSDEALVQQLTDNLELLNEEECYRLFRVCQNYYNNTPNNADNVELLAMKAFQRCSKDTKLQIIDERFTKNCFFDISETTEFNNMMTEIFNKLIVSPDTDLSVILNVFMQSPQRVYTKIFNLATENSQQTEIMLKLMSLLEKYSNHYYSHETEPCVIKITRNILDSYLDTEAKQQHFVNFMCGLKTANIIPGAKLLMLIIMPQLHKGLLNKDVCGINIQCRLLSEAYSLDELTAYRAPMLAMLAQVLDVVRWKIHTFVAQGPSTLTLALQLQKKLFETFNATGKEGDWLKSKLKNVDPLNIYYYRKLWEPPGNNLVEVVSGLSLHQEMDIEQLTMWLSQIFLKMLLKLPPMVNIQALETLMFLLILLYDKTNAAISQIFRNICTVELVQVMCSTTQTEWCDIWDSLAVFGDTTLDIFYNAFSLMSVAEAANRTENTRGCVLYCYSNFVFLMRYKFFKEPLTDSQVSTIANKLTLTANLLKEEDVSEIGTVILPLLAYLVERKNDYTFDLHDNLQQQPKLSGLVSKVFANGTD